MKILLFRGRGLMSAAIRWQTWSPWSHCAFMFRDGRVAEAWGGPFPFGKVSVLPGLKHGIEGIQFFDLHPALTPEQETQLETNLLDLARRRVRYDYFGVLRFLPRWERNSDNLGRPRFCSDLVIGELARVQYSLLKRINPKKVSPHLVGISPCLVRCNPPPEAFHPTPHLVIYPHDKEGLLP